MSCNLESSAQLEGRGPPHLLSLCFAHTSSNVSEEEEGPAHMSDQHASKDPSFPRSLLLCRAEIRAETSPDVAAPVSKASRASFFPLTMLIYFPRTVSPCKKSKTVKGIMIKKAYKPITRASPYRTINLYHHSHGAPILCILSNFKK